MYFGTDYHPEHWVYPFAGTAEEPESRWEVDAKLMVQAGMNVGAKGVPCVRKRALAVEISRPSLLAGSRPSDQAGRNGQMASAGASHSSAGYSTGSDSHTIESGSDFLRRREGETLMRGAGSAGNSAGGKSAEA